MVRRAVIVWSMVAALTTGGVALASPPENDPTCDRGTQGHGRECAGDNGWQGCQGIEIAEGTPAGEHAADALDLVNDILGEGAEGECGSE